MQMYRMCQVRDYMANARVVEALCLLLDHSNRDVLYSVCGEWILRPLPVLWPRSAPQGSLAPAERVANAATHGR